MSFLLVFTKKSIVMLQSGKKTTMSAKTSLNRGHLFVPREKLSSEFTRIFILAATQSSGAHSDCIHIACQVLLHFLLHMHSYISLQINPSSSDTLLSDTTDWKTLWTKKRRWNKNNNYMKYEIPVCNCSNSTVIPARNLFQLSNLDSLINRLQGSTQTASKYNCDTVE